MNRSKKPAVEARFRRNNGRDSGLDGSMFETHLENPMKWIAALEVALGVGKITCWMMGAAAGVRRAESE